ncbi:hypothetical protein AMTRI_Chr01g133680 [Amborella trichopoda]
MADIGGEKSMPLPLHKLQVSTCVGINRFLAFLHTCGIFALAYYRLACLPCLPMLIAELTFGLSWALSLGFRWKPIFRQTLSENLTKIIKESSLPAIDVFVCTADPFKEPPIGVVNTALSAMAFDYPTDKISVYVSDDGGSELTLFAFMEAAKFAKHWLPFCRSHGIQLRSPEAYFTSGMVNGCSYGDYNDIKVRYEAMKDKVESVVSKGCVSYDVLANQEECLAFKPWTSHFTPQDHPTVIQVVVLEKGKDVDVSGHPMPNLVYLSREKRKGTQHRFKAGALNALLRVSGLLSHAPILLTLDCDMYCSDPSAPRQALCYLLDPMLHEDLAFVQFPQRFQGVAKTDIYHCEHTRLFRINPIGMDGIWGAPYVGTGAFFQRCAFYGTPPVPGPVPIPVPQEDEDWDSDSDSESDRGFIRVWKVLADASQLAACTYEQGTDWGSKIGFRYGSLVEDYYTGYRLHCEGWKSVFCNPKRPAFLGDVPITLNDLLSQCKRWCVGLLEVGFSKYCPLTYGSSRISLLMGLGYAHYAFWALDSIPITIYALLPPLALLYGTSLFPKVSDYWFFLYAYLPLVAYAQDLSEFLMTGSSFKRWYNSQRMWMIKGVTAYAFALFQFSLQTMGIPSLSFNVTSKVVDADQSKRYEQEIFEFGVASPFFLTVSIVALINLIAFGVGILRVIMQGSLDGLFLQLVLCGFLVVNCWPVYEAMALRMDGGKIPAKVTLLSSSIAVVACMVVAFLAY